MKRLLIIIIILIIYTPAQQMDRLFWNGGDWRRIEKTANYDPEYEGDAATFNDCPGAFTSDSGIIIYEGNQSFPECIKYGAKIGGDKGGSFRKPFLKFFTENLLN